MQITVSKSELNQLLSLIQTIVEKRNTMPILANVLLTAADGTLRASATDLEITAVGMINAQVQTPGSTTVSARVFCDIVKELPEGPVTLNLTEGERIEIASGKSKMRVIRVSAEEYPALPGATLKPRSAILAKQLSEMISKTSYAVSLDETRFNLSGVCFDLVDGPKGAKALRMVATDGHRLSMITREAHNISFSDSVLVPRKGLTEIRKLVEGNNGEVGFDINEGFLVLESTGSQITSAKVAVRLIDGEFPDYKQVIPKDKGTVAVVASRDLSQALRRVSLMVTDKAKGVRLDFSAEQLRISSSSPELGDASEELAASYNGSPISVGFNAKYLMDFCDSISEDSQICVELHGELGPGKLWVQGDESYFGIVMPMRLVG